MNTLLCLNCAWLGTISEGKARKNCLNFVIQKSLATIPERKKLYVMSSMFVFAQNFLNFADILLLLLLSFMVKPLL